MKALAGLLARCRVQSPTCTSRRKLPPKGSRLRSGHNVTARQRATCQVAASIERHEQTTQQLLELRAQSRSKKDRPKAEPAPHLSRWPLTVGIEIHAQLNTKQKLFSEAPTPQDAEANENVTTYDLAFPGTQPILQIKTLLPALRAALALNCHINHESFFDRKHYCYHDQPAGYQITQYHKPFASNGHVILTHADVSSIPEDKPITIRIQQVQMEQDTAKSITQENGHALLDFNRAGLPLIEIISHPDIHRPEIAGAYVKKVQQILQNANAVTKGMEAGGLRADINVSVASNKSATLGQRVEIKNLNTLQSIQAAVASEWSRQADLRDAGETIPGETRGWTLRSIVSTRLRGKEGEVDYRYMPDPDIPPLLIGDDLVKHVLDTLPAGPDTIINDLTSMSGLTLKDAKALATLDDGSRLDYFDGVKEHILQLAQQQGISAESDEMSNKETAKIIANWILHELGHLLTTNDVAFSADLIPPLSLAKILHAVQTNRIQRTTAKQILANLFHAKAASTSSAGPDSKLPASVDDHLAAAIKASEQSNLSPEGYIVLAQAVMRSNPQMVREIKHTRKMSKVKWLLGQMMQQGKREGKVVKPAEAEIVLRDELGL